MDDRSTAIERNVGVHLRARVRVALAVRHELRHLEVLPDVPVVADELRHELRRTREHAQIHADLLKRKRREQVDQRLAVTDADRTEQPAADADLTERERLHETKLFDAAFVFVPLGVELGTAALLPLRPRVRLGLHLNNGVRALGAVKFELSARKR